MGGWKDRQTDIKFKIFNNSKTTSFTLLEKELMLTDKGFVANRPAKCRDANIVQIIEVL